MADYRMKPGMAAWFGAGPGMARAAQSILGAPAAELDAYRRELKTGAEVGKIMQEIHKLASEADLARMEAARSAAMEPRLLEVAATRAGVTVPEIVAAREALRGGPAGGVGPMGPVDYTAAADPRNRSIMDAIGELALSLAAPGKWSPENIGQFRVRAAEEPGVRARSRGLEEVVQRALGPTPESAYAVSGPLLGHHPPKESIEATTAVRSLQAALREAGVAPGSPEWMKAHRDFYTKQTTHAPPTAVNVMPPSQEWVKRDGRWYKWRLGKTGQQELVPAPPGFEPGSPTEDPIRAAVREALRQQAGGAPQQGPPSGGKRFYYDAQGNRVVK